MSRTYRNKHHSNLFSNGERGHHNSLGKEFRGIDGCWTIKSVRNLIHERDYDSDRMKATRHIMTQKRRTVMKRNTNKIINEQLYED